VGLGTIAVDLAAAVLVTSLLRYRLPERVWKAVHLTAFALWPIAIVHGIAMGTGNEPILRGVTIGCAVAGACAIGWRIWATDPDSDRRRSVALQWS
jgi:methionine sulfoxide reductase heme-binding subunit